MAIANLTITLPKNESESFQCETCGKTVTVSKLEQHVMEEHFWN